MGTSFTFLHSFIGFSLFFHRNTNFFHAIFSLAYLLFNICHPFATFHKNFLGVFQFFRFEIFSKVGLLIESIPTLESIKTMHIHSSLQFNHHPLGG